MRRLASSLLLLGLLACGGKKAPPGPPAAKVKLMTVTPQEVKQSSDFIASLNSRNAVTLRPQVTAVVGSVPVKPGQQVKAGATLVQLDVSQQAAVTANVRATVEARKAALQLAETNYQRISKLVPSGVVSQQEYDQAAAQRASAHADLSAAESQLRAQSVQSSYYRVTAPFDGIVGDLPVKVGDLVNPQTVITQFTQDRRLEAYVSVPLLLAPRLDTTTIVQVLGADDKPVVAAPVNFIAPTVDAATQTVLVKAVFENTQGLRYSQYVRVRLVYGQQKALVVPVVAIVRQGGQPFVYVAGKGDGKSPGLVAEQRPVQLGEVVGNDYVVTGGLKDGEQVVISGVQFVRNGAPLQPEQLASKDQGA
ncbi:MAG TPA: efflux RND transporter periplasmic adaptor subunit [Myxococcaceae bacterium]|jgi:RND family efflux transporter MFP subunit